MTTAISAADLRTLSTDELRRLFADLPAPTLAEMDGEYAARLLAQPGWLAGRVGRAVLEGRLHHWLCKAFRPVDADGGRGYNTFLQGGQIVQRYPMLTLIAPSRFDGRPAYQLVYRGFHSACGSVHMVDEVRRVAPGLYLGMGTYGFSDAMRRTPYPFVLEGPVAPYRGDIGRPRAGFSIGPRELPALHAC
ncbi:MAG: hypothetical protein Q8J78_14990 [Moraxellaceae bacterium]|nr:hypothetical protein [Moraxellaceae bacterium]